MVVNTSPTLAAIGSKTVDEQVNLTFTANATDPEVPPQVLTYSLDAAAIALGMSINSASGAFTWTPTELQGGSSYSATITVTDDGACSLADSEIISITVNEVNVAPVLALIGDQTVNVPATITFTATAADSDIPVNALAYSLDAASIALGMSINAVTGVFTWTPTIGQAGMTYAVTITVTDNGINPANLSDSETFYIMVNYPYNLNITVFLQGSYNTATGLMKPTLNTNGEVPLSQPYNTFPWDYTGTESVVTLGEDVVDWVLVELRSNLNTTHTRKAGLLHTNGTVTVSFNGLVTPGDEYYVVVWHRNHMPVMSANSIEIPFFGTSLDLSIPANCYGTEPLIQLIPTNIYGMIAGDVVADGQLKYSGPDNDRGSILAKIIALGGTLVTSTIFNGYWPEDVNMNNNIRYIGADNDRGLIISNITTLLNTTFLTGIYYSEVPGAYAGKKSQIHNNGPVNINLSGSEQGIHVVLSTGELIQNGVIDNLQFTLAWNANDTDMEETLSLFSSDYLLQKQGEPIKIGDTKYQVFITVTPTYLPLEWNPGEGLTVLTFDSELGGQISDRLWIADNSFTTQNNTMYYISIWGSDQTGKIEAPVVVSLNEPESAITISTYPNPVSDGKLTVAVESAQNQTLRINLFNVSGNLIIDLSWTIFSGHSTKVIDLSMLPPGAYIMSIVGQKVNYQKKLILLTVN